MIPSPTLVNADVLEKSVATIDITEMGKRAKTASFALASLTTTQKNSALTRIAELLEQETPRILEANRQDVLQAQQNGVDPVWIRDRLDLTTRMKGIIADVRHVVTLADPVGEEYAQRILPNDLHVSKRRVPIGVLGVIYESRPNVTVDISTLALKTGNAVILRGGSDTLNTNLALVAVLRQALAENNIPDDAMQYIASTNRDYVRQMLKLHQYIDMIIPRGGNSLHTFCRDNSTIPVIIGGMGICHLFVDETARLDASLEVIFNAKTQRPAVCNALDTLLVHRAVAQTFLPTVLDKLAQAGVIFKADAHTRDVLDDERVMLAGADDFDTEWMGLTLGIKVVDGVSEAIAHIRQHSTQHSDGILTENPENATYFLNAVDSATVYHNASTRFTDGSALGLGAEVAISTQKLHARGPMALEELTTYKWVVVGNYTVRQ
jgi:glutamate-5-semialdehyde dehydrogenase